MPKYKYIYGVIRNDIVLQNVNEGDFLPTEQQLMESFDASRSTVRHALSMLQEDGYIQIRQGSGSVVLPRKDVKFGTAIATSFKELEVEFFTDGEGKISISSRASDRTFCPENAAKALGIETGTAIARFQCLWSIDGNPYSYMVQYIREDVMPGVLNYVDEGSNIYDTLEEHYGLSFTGGEEHITAQKADFVEANILGIEMGDALMCTTRIGLCEKGPFEYATFYGNPKYTGYVVGVRGGRKDGDPERKGLI